MLPIICRSAASILQSAARAVPANLSSLCCKSYEDASITLEGGRGNVDFPYILRFLSSKPSPTAAAGLHREGKRHKRGESHTILIASANSGPLAISAAAPSAVPPTKRLQSVAADALEKNVYAHTPAPAQAGKKAKVMFPESFLDPGGHNRPAHDLGSLEQALSKPKVATAPLAKRRNHATYSKNKLWPRAAAESPVSVIASSCAHTSTAAAAIGTLHRLHLKSVEQLFLQHHESLDSASVEKIVSRVLQLATPTFSDKSRPVSAVSHPATVLSRLLTHKPALTVRAATDLLIFFACQPTQQRSRMHLLSTLCDLPDDQFQQINIRQAGDILCAMSTMLPTMVPTVAADTKALEHNMQLAATAVTPAVMSQLHRACTDFSHKLVQHTTGLVSNTESSLSPRSFCGPEALSVLCVGAARFQVRNLHFWDNMASLVTAGSLAGASVHMCSNVAWAFTVAGTDSKHLCDVFLRIAELVVRKDVGAMVSPTSRSQLLAAFGKVGFHHAPLFDKVLSSCVTDCSKLDALNVTSLLLACARVGHDRQLVDKLLQQLAVSPAWEHQLASQTSHRLAANMLWSLSVLEMLPDHHSLVSRLLLLFKQTAPRTQLSPLEAMQLMQVKASLLKLGIGILGLPSTTQLVKLVSAGSIDKADFNSIRGSKAQKDLFQRLSKLIGSNGVLCVQEELQLIDGLVGVDVLVTFRCGRRVAVEMDGPSHFLLSDNSKIGGSTRWRNDTVAHELGGRHNLVCIKRDGPQWLNYISGRSVEGGADKFLLYEILDGAKQASK